MVSNPNSTGGVTIDKWLKLRELGCLALPAEHSIWEPEEHGLVKGKRHADVASSLLVKSHLTRSRPSWPHTTMPGLEHWHSVQAHSVLAR